MGIKHYCDVCGEEMSEGYTLEWREELDDTGSIFTAKIPEKQKKSVCYDCWPGESDWSGLLGRLVK